MRVKRYVVDSMPEALQKIRQDLGKDAVILNTKEIRQGGLFGLFARRKIEVIAATDNTVGVSKPSANHVVPPREQVSPETHRPPVPEAAGQSGEEARRAPALTYQSPLLSAGSPNEEGIGSSGQERDDLLLKELKQMKELVRQLTSLTPSAGFSAVPPYLRKLEQRLLDHEIEPRIVKKLFENISLQDADNLNEEQKYTFAVRHVANRMKQMLLSRRSKPINPNTRICHFVGPTGVGKTTTIAKLAAEQVLKYNRKVGFITSDTYRIAAVEQLRTYANILNVPLQVVMSPQELNRALEELKHCDMILMDTAGRNYRNEMYVSELNSLLKNDENSETFLVLSLATKYKDMKAITENFLKYKLDKVLFTKLDETDSFGSIINMANDFQLTFSYVTYGQNVPDDIRVLDEDHIIDLILEEKSDE